MVPPAERPLSCGSHGQRSNVVGVDDEHRANRSLWDGTRWAPAWPPRPRRRSQAAAAGGAHARRPSPKA
eukprot:6558055-Alexandrium_andersonii.AAC.1